MINSRWGDLLRCYTEIGCQSLGYNNAFGASWNIVGFGGGVRFQQVSLANRGVRVLACVIKAKILPDSIVTVSQEYRIVVKESFNPSPFHKCVLCDLV